MEHESFEDDETARLMNERFVCVKVDREERPDVDGLYMEAVVSLTGHGGWPMTVFLAPEPQAVLRRNVLPAGAALQHAELPADLLAISEAYGARRGRLEQVADQIVDAIRQGSERQPSSLATC